MLSKEQLLQVVFSGYEGIFELLKTHTYDEIVEAAAQAFGLDRTSMENTPMGGYSKGKTSGAYAFVIMDLLRNIEKYDWLYQNLEDTESRYVLTDLLRFRILPDMQFIESAYDSAHPQYFDNNIISCDENEVFVDCGGFVGDTAEKFIEIFEKYKSIYVYEPSSDNIDKCRQTLEGYKNIYLRNAGVGEKSTTMHMDNNGASSSFVAAHADYSIDIINLDEDIKEPVTFIKMDIEGFEIPAILGAKNHIRDDYPKLAICTYHIISDLWEIPMLINTIRPDYRFYLRHYQEDQNWETVLYAIPQEKKERKPKKPHRIVAMAPYECPWSNVELVKDCGLIPYLLYKNHGCDVSMVGAKGGDYPYAKLVEGMKLEGLENGSVKTKKEYIAAHGKEIDCLILRGCYKTNFGVAQVYKTVNPEGKIYVGLDANSWWMGQIIWDDPDFMSFMDCCDVIGTSCTAMQKFLNEKWPWRIECLPNGFYDLFGVSVSDMRFEEKEPVILTVGRLGTTQKATEVLMEAFAKIADRLPEWRVRLVGSIEANFEEYKRGYFKRNPKLKKRVIFTGPIQDRAELRKEYERAKIFALPSTMEGGTPNVVAEALYAGCAMAVTKIDAYEDAINHGACGKAVEINDVDGFAQMLLELCTEADLEKMSENALAHGKEFFDMEKIVGGLYEQLSV